MFDSTFWDVTKASLLGAGLSLALLVCYRLYLHPLAKFPGPTLAAISDYYTAYYDIWMRGGLVKQLEKLHQIYGKLRTELYVRLTPTTSQVLWSESDQIR